MFKYSKLLVICLILTSCSNVKISEVDKLTTSDVAIFRYGPAQTLPPKILPKGELVKEIQLDSGYSIVKTKDGSTGWVDSTFLVNAPPKPKPQPQIEKFSRKLMPIFSAQPDFTSPNEVIPLQ